MTPYQTIYSRFSTKVQDYNLDALYQKSVDSYESFLKGFLISAIPFFVYCQKDLEDRDDDAQIFNVDLNGIEQEILATLMQYHWMDREVNNIEQMRLALSNSDFKRYAESQNLKAKMDERDSIMERANGLMIQYSYKNYNPEGS